MSLFLTPDERRFILEERTSGVAARLYWSTFHRVMRRAESPGLLMHGDTSEWWHLVEEAIGDAAIIHALQPSPVLSAWLRNAVLGVVRRPAGDWIGPWFRNHSRVPLEASLETGHISVAVAAGLDLARDVFTDAEISEIEAILCERAIPMALEHLNTEKELHNHWCVINAGLAAAAAVVNHREGMERAAKAYIFYCNAFQPDGTYAESLQYANYACLNLMLTYESLVRRDASFASRLKPESYAGIARWAAYAHLYTKPLSKWGQEPIPRAINFGDSAAIFTPSAELLLHISARTKSTRSTEAALARWLFDTVVDAVPSSPPHDRASFGFVNRPGFLTLPLLASAGEGKSPEALGQPLISALGCGDVIARDAWNGKTTLAVRTGGDPMHVVSHVHGDMNSLVLVHNRERLLVDPGHSCYRNIIRELDCSSSNHSTCTFEVPGESRERVQGGIANRKHLGDELEPPLPAKTRRLLVAADGSLRVTVSDAAGRYGAPIEHFIRIVVLCGEHVVFVIDDIRSSVPVRTRWNWLLNNRDGRGELKVTRPNQLEFRRGDAGIRIFNQSGAHVGGPQYTFVHDAYHPLPNQLGEGGIGSGVLLHWREATASAQRNIVHSIAVDDAGRIASWHHSLEGSKTTLLGREGTDEWSVETAAPGGRYLITNQSAGDVWTIESSAGAWSLRRALPSL